jgi:diguanylate cyclase (GGDEF)-like protein/PAS domain S-box-containing protein
MIDPPHQDRQPAHAAHSAGERTSASRHRQLPLVLAPLVAAFMLGLTFLYWKSEENSARTKREHYFQTAADHIAYNLKDRMAAYELVLRGLKGYFEGSEFVDDDEFRAYVGALQLAETRPGLRGVSVVRRVPATEKAAHEAEMRKLGFAGYAIHPAGQRDVYTPMTHVEALTRGARSGLGFDVSSSDAAREALQRASDSGRLTVSGLLDLVQESGSTVRGLTMYQPIYRQPGPQGDEDARHDDLMGWVSASFAVPDVITGMAKEFDNDVRLQIFDGAQALPQARLYGAAKTVPDDDDDEEGAAEPPGGLVTERTLIVGGRQWLLHMTPQPNFFARFNDAGHSMVALMGCLLSALVACLTWLLATGRERALALARSKTVELSAARDDLESTLNAIPDLLFEVDIDGRIYHYRSARADALAVQPELFLGQWLTDLVSSQDTAGCRVALETAQRVGYSSGHQYRQDINGTLHWFELSIARKESTEPGAPVRFIALSRDITERKRAEARTHQLAYFDALTGLPNRRMLLDRMENVLRAAQDEAVVGAVFYIDLDNFKQINDARGHGLGDMLLEQVALRLARLQRPGDTVARLGGDEFVVLSHHLAKDLGSASRAAAAVAEDLRMALEAPYAIDAHLYSLTGSIGVTLFPKRAEGVEDLLREADTAMYRAKDLGRNRIRFYETAMHIDVQERLALEQDLQQAHAEGQLSVFVQNQVDAQGRVVGGELLMRWNHPVRGNVPPSRFIPIAESSGLILRLGDWMIQQACETLALLQAQGRALALSVNVSERQFRQDDFVERVRQVLARTGAHPSNLILEVTESLLIEDLDDTIARMTEIVRMGVRFSIDDFGTGYSSLAYLKRLPLFELKIDKSFVQDTPDDPSDTAIVQSIIAVARHLKLRVVAEGVETQAQADFLTRSHCDCLQGYLFGRPEPLLQWVAHLEELPTPQGRS